MKYSYRTGIQKFKIKLVNFSTALVVGFTGMTGAAPLFISGTAHAAGTTKVTPAQLNGWTKFDMRGAGVAEITSQKADKNGGNGSLNLALSSGSDKAGFIKSANYGPANGLSNLSFDWYRDSSSTAAGHFTPAVGIYVSDSTDSNVWLLKWEGVYNGYPVAGPGAPTNTWTTENLLSAKFWRIPQVVNGAWVGYDGCKQDGDPHKCWNYTRTLQDDWLKDFDVVGVDVSVGSGWSGTYNSYVDNLKINDTVFDFEAAPVLRAENFNTTDLATDGYAGISVGFSAKDFGAITDVTVDITRADGTHAYKYGAQGVKDLLSGKTATTQATAPFVFKEGSYNQATDFDKNGNLYWQVRPTTDWTTATAPVSVKITVTDENGPVSIVHGIFNQGAPSWPAYNALVRADVPTNLQIRYQYDATYLANGSTVNKTSKPGNSLELTWDDPSSATIDAHITEEVRPDETSEEIWTGSRNVWLTAGNKARGANDGQAEFGVHGDGAYTYRVKVRNAANNQWSDWSQPFVLSYDANSPVAEFTKAPANNSYVNGNFHVEATASDGAKLKDVSFDVRDPNAPAGTNAYRAGCVNGTLEREYSADYKSATLSCDINTTGLTEGVQYYVRVHANDYAGYGSKDSAPQSIRYFTVDRTAPTAPKNLTWLDSNGKSATNGFTNVQKGTLSWEDTDTDVDHYVYKFWTNVPGYHNGEANAWTTDSWDYIKKTSTGGSIWTDFANIEGTYYFCIVAVDAAGNTSECSETYSVTYDNTAPAIDEDEEGFSRPMGTGEEKTLAPIITDASGIKSYVWTADKSLLNKSKDTKDGPTLNIGPAPAGSYTITLTVTDNAGNSTTVTYTITISNPGRGGDKKLDQKKTPTTPQVQGVNTTAALQSTAAPASESGTVKGDSAEKKDTIAPATETKADDTNKTSAFLGLGWWWLVVLAVAGGLGAFLFRRADTNEVA